MKKAGQRFFFIGCCGLCLKIVYFRCSALALFFRKCKLLFNDTCDEQNHSDKPVRASWLFSRPGSVKFSLPNFKMKIKTVNWSFKAGRGIEKINKETKIKWGYNSPLNFSLVTKTFCKLYNCCKHLKINGENFMRSPDTLNILGNLQRMPEILRAPF